MAKYIITIQTQSGDWIPLNKEVFETKKAADAALDEIWTTPEHEWDNLDLRKINEDE